MPPNETDGKRSGSPQPGARQPGAQLSNEEELIRTVNQVMPFGRFRGSKLINLPEPYLVWFSREGFPSGTLGRRMALMHEIKVNGLETMLKPLIQST